MGPNILMNSLSKQKHFTATELDLESNQDIVVYEKLLQDHQYQNDMDMDQTPNHYSMENDAKVKDKQRIDQMEKFLSEKIDSMNKYIDESFKISE